MSDCGKLQFHFGQEDIYFASVKGKILKCRGALPIYSFVAQIADFPALPSKIKTHETFGGEDITMLTTSVERSDASIESLEFRAGPAIPLDEEHHSNSIEHERICARTKKMYEA